jgi:hypothetical protein
VRRVIERDWGRQLAQKCHNLPAPQNRPSGPWIEPYFAKFCNHFRKETKGRASRAAAPLYSTGLRLPFPGPFPPATSSSNKVRCAIPCRFSFPPEPVASVLCSPGRRLPVLVPPPGGPPKKSLRDFATLANFGHFALRSA